MSNLFRLKVTSAVLVDGLIKRAGEIIELAEREARDLLRREKCVPHDGPMPCGPPDVDVTDAKIGGLAEELKSSTASLADAIEASAPADDSPPTRGRKK